MIHLLVEVVEVPWLESAHIRCGLNLMSVWVASSKASREGDIPIHVGKGFSIANCVWRDGRVLLL
jgi:hypothetical protein